MIFLQPLIVRSFLYYLNKITITFSFRETNELWLSWQNYFYKIYNICIILLIFFPKSPTITNPTRPKTSTKRTFSVLSKYSLEKLIIRLDFDNQLPHIWIQNIYHRFLYQLIILPSLKMIFSCSSLLHRNFSFLPIITIGT